MGKFGWSYPPGCTQADVDRAAGVTPEAEAEEDFRDEMWSRITSNMDDNAISAVCDYAWSKIGEAYKLGYDQGQSDAHLAVRE